MPLHAHTEAFGISYINRLGGAVRGVAINHHTRARLFDPLAMQGIGAHDLRPKHPREDPAWGEAYIMTQGKFLFQSAIGGMR